MPRDGGAGALAEATEMLLAAYSGVGGRAGDLPFAPLVREDATHPMAAVDGGSCVVLDVVSCGCLAVRAGSTVRSPDDAYADGPLTERVYVVSRRSPDAWWQGVLSDFAWGLTPTLPPPRTRNAMALWADAARSVLEYHTARTVLNGLDPGSVLLVDGALEDDPAGLGLTRTLVERAETHEVAVVAVSKDSARSISGLLPFTLELEDAAGRADAPPRFMVDVTEALGLGRQGIRTFGVRFDARAPVFRVDVPEAQTDEAPRLIAQVAASCNDPTVPGYPYPLARAHRTAHYAGDAVVDLRRGMESLVSERRGTRIGMRLFGRGRDVLDLAG